LAWQALVAGVLLSPSVVHLEGSVVRISAVLLLSLGTLFLLMFERDPRPVGSPTPRPLRSCMA
jgi:hypothetical protein